MQNVDLEAQLLSHKEANISSDLPFREWLYAWLLNPHIEGNYQKTIERWIGILIVANLFALMLSLIHISEPTRH